MMRIEIEQHADGERRALLNLGDGVEHSLRLEKAAELAIWIEELLPEEVAKARQPKVPDRAELNGRSGPGSEHKEEGTMATSNPICQWCGLEMEIIGIGWLAVYMDYFPPTPYEVRRGDLCACAGCGQGILTNFADGRPMGFSLGEPFEQEIAAAVRTGKFVVVWDQCQDPAKVPNPHKYLVDWLNSDKYLVDWLAERQAAREEGRS